jgi:hypothetical protein
MVVAGWWWKLLGKNIKYKVQDQVGSLAVTNVWGVQYTKIKLRLSAFKHGSICSNPYLGVERQRPRYWQLYYCNLR